MKKSKLASRYGDCPRRNLRSAATIVVAGALMMAGLGACGGDDEGESADGGADGNEPIVLGMAMALTGPNNGFDGPEIEGARIAVEDINAKGGVNGRPLEIVTADNRSDPDQLAPAALKVLEDGAVAIHTSCDFDFGAPAARVAGEQGVPAFSCAGSPLFGMEGLGEFAFNTYATTPIEGAVMAEYAYNDLGFRNAFVLEDTSIQYTKDLCRYFNERWEELGGTVAGSDTFENDDPSIRPQVNRLRNTPDVDFVALCTYVPGGPTAVRQIRAEVDAPIVASIAMDVLDPLTDAAPNLSEFYNVSLGSLTGDDSSPGRTRLGQKYEELTGEKPPTAHHPLLGYAFVELVVQAIKEAGGSTDGEDLAEALHGFDNVKTISGPISYPPGCGLDPERQVAMSEVQGGERRFLGSYKPESVPEAPC